MESLKDLKQIEDDIIQIQPEITLGLKEEEDKEKELKQLLL